jgi:hypothetical protein
MPADNLDYNSGTVTTYFSRLDVSPQGTRIMLTDIKSIGVDGQAWRRESLNAPPFDGESVVYVASFPLADALRVVYEALVGRLVTINRNSMGLNSPNVMVADVAVAVYKPIAQAHFVILPDGSTSSGVAAEVRARWKFQYGGPP